MAAKHQLKQSIYQLLKQNAEGSFETQAARKHILNQVADALTKGGYKLKHMRGIKQKHIQFLVQSWQDQPLTDATIKNRMSHLRWLCTHLGKDNVVQTNDELGIGRRKYKTNVNKAIELQAHQLEKLRDPFVKVSLHLQRHLGLRREESIKIKPHIADKGDHIYLHTGWCKGGRARVVPVDTKEARYWLDEAKKLVSDPRHSLIPTYHNYKQQRDHYDKQIQKIGIKHAHGLRHAYAQQRYQEITGWLSSICGGPKAKELSKEQRDIDRIARNRISEELGHSRISILASYVA